MTSESTTEKVKHAAARISMPAWLAIGAIAIALLASGIAVMAWYQVAVTGRLEAGAQRSVVERVSGDFESLRETQRDVAGRLEALQQELAELKGDTARVLEDEVRARRDALDQFRREFEALSDSVQRVYEDLGRSVDTWMLEEAEQLLLLANQRLSLVNDTGLAMTALRLADHKLQEIGEPSLIPVRGRIADELAALSSVPALDVTGAALRIDAMRERIGDMPLSGDMDRPEWELGEPGERPEAADGEGGVREFAREVIDDLGALVRVRRVEETRLPRLKPVQRFLVHENLRLLLSGAQYALLRNDGEIFIREISSARSWIEKYYDGEADPVGRFVAELDELADLPITREVPSIDGSLELLRETIGERASR